MANSRKPGPLQSPIGMCVIPARTPGPMGMFDQGDPNVTTALGDTPGPLGYNDANDPSISIFGSALGVPRRFSSLAELNAGSQIRAMSHGEAFFTFHPFGRALHGYAESALAITRSPLTLAEGVGNLLNDAYGYSMDQLVGPKTGVMGDARPYSAASGLLQSIQRDGWLGTTGNIVRGTILSLPGIAQIDGMYHRDPHAFGASLPATFLALSGRMATGQGGASRSGGTMVKGAGSEPARASRTSNASRAQDSGATVSQRGAEAKAKGSAPGVVAGTNTTAEIANESAQAGKYAIRNDVSYRPASEVNATFPDGWSPPYKPGSRVTEFTNAVDDTYVRVHGENNMTRSWMMKPEAIDGLTPAQIQSKYALPELPTYVSEVLVPAGTRIRTGIVNPVFGGIGSATQYELLQRLPASAFSNTVRIGQ